MSCLKIELAAVIMILILILIITISPTDWLINCRTDTVWAGTFSLTLNLRALTVSKTGVADGLVVGPTHRF